MKLNHKALWAVVPVVGIFTITGATALSVYLVKRAKASKKSAEPKTISSRGIELIKHFESFRSSAYLDSKNVATIGYGHTHGVRLGDTCTLEQAEDWLRQDCQEAEAVINQQHLLLSQNQFDALVSFVYNVGRGNFTQSTLLKKALIDADDPTIEQEFLRWVYSGNKVLNGLTARRQAEANLYFGKA